MFLLTTVYGKDEQAYSKYQEQDYHRSTYLHCVHTAIPSGIADIYNGVDAVDDLHDADQSKEEGEYRYSLLCLGFALFVVSVNYKAEGLCLHVYLINEMIETERTAYETVVLVVLMYH